VTLVPQHRPVAQLSWKLRNDQPAPVILDLATRRPEQPGKRVLNDILGRADVPKHPEGQVHQIGAVSMTYLDDLRICLLFSHIRLRACGPA
jgi:hypothetical protein